MTEIECEVLYLICEIDAETEEALLNDEHPNGGGEAIKYGVGAEEEELSTSGRNLVVNSYRDLCPTSMKCLRSKRSDFLCAGFNATTMGSMTILDRSFSAPNLIFDKQRILRLAEFYPNEFTTTLDRMKLDFQLQTYIHDLRNDVRFQQVMDLGSLSIMLVETNKHKTYTEVYLLLKLVLILPVATASVERVFSAMSFVKSKLRNSMGDQLLNDSLVTFIEKDIFRHVSDESVLRRFQDMKTRRINF
uniref:HAT C-terminal dimerisation domain-containing protein n=1 Tax=Kalanchoe fedtschenkoi TaxID=63787 RepID=A0A7N0UM43_KALFE